MALKRSLQKRQYRLYSNCHCVTTVVKYTSQGAGLRNSHKLMEEQKAINNSTLEFYILHAYLI